MTASVVNFETLTNLLKARRYDETYTNVPTNNIGDELKSQFTKIFNYVGESLPDSFLVVRAENKIFQKLYTPIVYRVTAEQAKSSDYGKSNELPAELPGVRFTKDLIVPLNAFLTSEGDNIDITEQAASVLLPECETFPNGLLIDFPLFHVDVQNIPKSFELKRAFKKGNLQNYLSEVKTGTSFIKLYELGENTEHIVVGYDSRETQYGTMYSLTLDNGIRVMCNKAIEAVLKASPNITPSLPANLVISTIGLTKQGHKKVNAVLEPSPGAFSSVGGISLDW